MRRFNGVRVFTATTVAPRLALGDQVTAWLEQARAARPGFQIVDILVRQSSDSAFHAVTIIVFFYEDVRR